jgi:hypothetical protein
MLRRLALLTIAGAAIVLPGSLKRAVADGYSILVVTPIQGHSHDIVYLSGDGLEPNKRLAVTMDCPNALDKSVSQYNNGILVPKGPITNAHGQFRDFPFQVLTLRHFASLLCTIYVQDHENYLGPDFPATFDILPPGQAVDAKWKKPPVHIKEVPKQVKSGLIENISVRSWPGATAVIRVSYAGARARTQKVALNLKGFGRVAFKVSFSGAASTVAARVQVRIVVGTYHASGTSGFTIRK